ncbi:MAG: hypothetical protein LBT13_01330 [Treponema sp.]|nr:hypothetical protein [Treponema sp.]
MSLFAGNPHTEATARELVEQGNFITLNRSEDESLVWGSCIGSGAEAYHCSVDFLDPERPLGRCTCPNRHKPCKHSIGLLYALFVGHPFAVCPIPPSLLKARDKDKAKAEKEAKPVLITRAKALSEAKNCTVQLEGITLGEKMLHNIVLTGIYAITDAFDTQIQELGNYNISGIQAGFTELMTLILTGQKNTSAAEPADLKQSRGKKGLSLPPFSKDFEPALRQLTYLYALLKKSRTYLEHKQADYAAFPELTHTAEADMLNSAIEEQIGYTWKLTELKAKGCMRTGVELVQCAFSVYEDDVRKQYVDEGIWLSLGTRDIYMTRNVRPYRLNKPPQDSFFKVLIASELYIYPGDKNPQVRWERQAWRDLNPEDFTALATAGAADFNEVIEAVKVQIRNPLAAQEPVFALHITRMGIDREQNLSVFDPQGKRIALKPTVYGNRIRSLSREQVEGKTLVARFKQDMDQDMLYAVPLSLVTDKAIIRLI